MGIIEPMAINTAVATGLLELGGWSAAWWIVVSVLGGAFGGILACARPAAARRDALRCGRPTLAEHLA